MNLSHTAYGEPTGIYCVVPFAYCWSLSLLNNPGNNLSLFPFVPEHALANTSSETEYINFHNFDFDSSEMLDIFTSTGDYLGIPAISSDSITESVCYNLYNTESAWGYQRNCTWQYRVGEEMAAAATNLVELWTTIDNENSYPYTDGTPLPVYLYPIFSQFAPDHVNITAQDGRALADGAEFETIYLQITDSNGNPARYLRTVYVTIEDTDPNPANIMLVSNGTISADEALVNTDETGFGSISVRRYHNNDGDLLDNFLVNFHIHWDGYSGLAGSADSFGTSSSNFITINFIENPDPILSSNANYSFNVGDPLFYISNITIQNLSPGTNSKINAIGDIRLRIPASLDCTWDTSLGTFGGSGYSFVGSYAFESGNKVMFIDVLTNFSQADTLVLNMAALKNFNSVSSGSLELSFDGGITYRVVDDKFYAIR